MSLRYDTIVESADDGHKIRRLRCSNRFHFSTHVLRVEITSRLPTLICQTFWQTIWQIRFWQWQIDGERSYIAGTMPDGFTLGAEPSKLDASLVGKHIYMRWKD